MPKLIFSSNRPVEAGAYLNRSDEEDRSPQLLVLDWRTGSGKELEAWRYYDDEPASPISDFSGEFAGPISPPSQWLDGLPKDEGVYWWEKDTGKSAEIIVVIMWTYRDENENAINQELALVTHADDESPPTVRGAHGRFSYICSLSYDELLAAQRDAQ